MSQQSSAESSNRLSLAQSINPALKAVLGSIDVHLEEELTRYRRQRAGHSAPPVKGWGRYSGGKSIDLTPVGISSKTPTAVKPRSTLVSPQPKATGSSAATDSLAEAETQTVQTEQQDTSTPAVSFDLSADSPASSQLAIVATPESAENAANENFGQSTDSEKQPAVNPEFIRSGRTNPAPDSYLESTEQLLRSLTEEEASNRTEPGFLDSLFTPLGVGSLLLLLVSSVTLGYVVTNPSTLSHLGLDQYWKSSTPSTAQNPTSTTPTTTTPATTPTTTPSAGNTPIPSGPDLATDEFVDLDLNNLRTFKSTPTPSSVPGLQTLPSPQVPATSAVPSMSPSVAESPSDLNPSPLSPSVPSVAPLPEPSAPSRNPIPTVGASQFPTATTQPPQQTTPTQSVTPIATPTSNPQGFYYVVAPNNGAQALERVRQIIPDAYVLPDGTRIQLGAFKKQSEAQSLVTELQRQGISAEVSQP